MEVYKWKKQNALQNFMQRFNYVLMKLTPDSFLEIECVDCACSFEEEEHEEDSNDSNELPF